MSYNFLYWICEYICIKEIFVMILRVYLFVIMIDGGVGFIYVGLIGVIFIRFFIIVMYIIVFREIGGYIVGFRGFLFRFM